MASLATGIVKNTTITGVPSIAVAGTDYLDGNSTNITGLISGGIVTVNGGDATKIDISSAVYYIQGTRYTYAGATGLAN